VEGRTIQLDKYRAYKKVMTTSTRKLGVLISLLSMMNVAIATTEADANARLEAAADEQEQAKRNYAAERAKRDKRQAEWLALDSTKKYTGYLCALVPGSKRDSEWKVAAANYSIVAARDEETDRVARNSGLTPIRCPLQKACEPNDRPIERSVSVDGMPYIQFDWKPASEIVEAFYEVNRPVRVLIIGPRLRTVCYSGAWRADSVGVDDFLNKLREDGFDIEPIEDGIELR
jgi:hypothetical protein